MESYPRRMNEVLSDNRNIEKCRACTTCIFNNDGTPYSSIYTKACCQIYPYPMCKPVEVINNGLCEFKEVEL